MMRTIIVVMVTAALWLTMLPLAAEEETVRAPEEILAEAGEIPTAEAIIELFINCSEWDEPRAEVQTPSREALVELGVLAVPTLLEEYLSSQDVRRRVELDNVIREIGNPASEYILPYVDRADSYTRRHAAYLLGDTAAAQALEDPARLGPLDEDLPAITALQDALEIETDWHVTSTILGALGKMRDPQQILPLETYLDDDEQALRLAAVIALGRIPDQEAARPMIRAFADPMMNVRQASVLALSTETMGNLAFEALLGTIALPPGQVERICALETVARYLQVIASDRSNRTDEQRERAFDAAISVIDNATQDMWAVRGYAVDVIGFTYQEEAEAYLETLAESEEHPFVIGKTGEALDRLAEGMPEPEDEQ